MMTTKVQMPRPAVPLRTMYRQQTNLLTTFRVKENCYWMQLVPQLTFRIQPTCPCSTKQEKSSNTSLMFSMHRIRESWISREPIVRRHGKTISLSRSSAGLVRRRFVKASVNNFDTWQETCE